MFKKKWKAMTTIELSYRAGAGSAGLAEGERTKLKVSKAVLTNRKNSWMCKGNDKKIYITLLYCCVGESSCAV
jgi:hypothetical protein